MRRIRLAVTLACLPAPIAAQALTFDDFAWTFSGPPSSSGFVTSDLMHVTGPDAGCDYEYAAFTTTAPFAGTVRTRVTFDTFDDCYFDWPGHAINGLFFPDQPDFTGCWSDVVFVLEFDVQAGDAFGLGVFSTDCIFGPGLADFTDFTFLPPAWLDAGGVLDPRLELDVAATDPAETFGQSVVAIGDGDGDGLSELAVGGFKGHPAKLKIHLLSGASGATLWTVGDLGGSAPRLVAMGDVTGDGFPDVALGGGTSSIVRVLSGADGSVAWTWTWSGSPLDNYAVIAAHADVDADGLLDLAVGASNATGQPVRVLSGATGAELGLIQPAPGDVGFGSPLGAPGDVDGDGVGDLMVGVSGAAKSVRVVSGASGAALLELQAPGDPTDWSIAVFAGLGDWNVDGVPDMAVGAPFDYFGPLSGGLGSVALYSGATGGLLHWLKAPVELREFGAALAGGVDVTGDGAPDLAISAPAYPPVYQGPEPARIRIVRSPDAAIAQEITDAGIPELGRALAWQSDAPPTLAATRRGVVEVDRLRLYSDLSHPAGKPWMSMHGGMAAGLPWSIGVEHGLPGNLGLLCLGLSAVNLPFKGGVLVPAVDAVVPIVLDGTGAWQDSATAPGGITPDLTLWLQAWMPDAAGPQGWAATRAQSSAPP